MPYVLFLESDCDSVYSVRKFPSLQYARAYCSRLSFLGSINLIIASDDLQIIHFKSFCYGKNY